MLGAHEEAVLHRIESMRDEIVSFLQTIVRIPTVNPPGKHYAQCAEVIGERLREFDYEVKFVAADGRPEHTAEHPRVNVIGAMELILKYPAAAPDPQVRFDTLNGLLQTVRTRWEARSTSQVKSVRFLIQDVDRSIVTIEKSLHAMDELRPQTAVAAADWDTRKIVIERVLLRPLRGCRAELLPREEANRATAEAARAEMKKNKK